MFHVLAYKSAFAASTTDGDMAGVTDNVVPIDASNHFIPDDDLELWLSTAFGTLVQRAKLATPRLRTISKPSLYPIFQGTAAPNNPILGEYFRSPLTLKRIDPIQVLVTTTTAVAENQVALLWVGKGPRTIPPGDVITCRWTSTLSTVAFGWAAGSITLDEGLPGGRYAVVGFSCVGATDLAARIIFPGGVGIDPISQGGKPYRPGCLAQTAIGNFPSRYFRWGRLGVYGTFDSFAVPTIEIFNSAAGVVVHEGVLDLIKIT